MAYAALADVRAYLKFEALQTGDDTLLSGFLTRAQRIIEALPPLGTGRVFEAAADTTRKVDCPTDGSRLLLFPRYWDLCAITSVTNGDGTTVAATEYTTQPRSSTPYYALALKRGSNVAWEYDDSPEEAITIVGKWVYSTTAPADIVQATIRLAAWLYRQKDGSNQDDQAVTTPVGVIVPSSLPRDVRMIIEAYRNL